MYNYCQSMPDIPDVDMEFSEDSVTAYVEGGEQRTKEIIFKADVLQTITFKLPTGVKLHNVRLGDQPGRRVSRSPAGRSCTLLLP